MYFHSIYCELTVTLTDIVTILSSPQTAELLLPWVPGAPAMSFQALGPHQVIFHVPGLDPSPRELSTPPPTPPPPPEALGSASLCPLEGAHNSW